MAVAEMGVEIRWRSEQGHRTDDNSDCCGVGLRGDAVLAVVLDGSSNGKASGAFARNVARNLIDWFVVAEVVTPKTIIDRLRVIHAELSRTYRRDSASVVIALIERQGGRAFSTPVIVLQDWFKRRLISSGRYSRTPWQTPYRW